VVPLHQLNHLARRFFGSLSPANPPLSDEAWAEASLLAGEVSLWRRMSGPDRRHAVGVARRVVGALGDARATRPVIAAALLHDVGKIESGLGTFARVPATVLPVQTGRIGRYRRHDQLGAALLLAAGSDPLTIAWAREHHMPAAKWTLAPHLANALKAADDD
jgi:hypothetical protein